MKTVKTRGTQAILRDHLDKAREGSIDSDLSENFAEDLVLLGNWGVHHGHAGARYLAELLQQQLPGAQFDYDIIQVEGEVGFLKWRATAANGHYVEDGADSFVIRNGQIVAQTIYYTVAKSN